MPVIQGLIASAALLVCVLFAAEQPSLPGLVRGALSNILLFWLLFFLVDRVSTCWPRRVGLGLIALLLSAAQAHVLINGAYPAVGHAGLALDDSFLKALLGDRVFVGLLVLNLVWVAALEVAWGRGWTPRLSVRLAYMLLPVFLVFVVGTKWFTPGISAHWYAQNVLEHQFRWGAAPGLAPGLAVLDGRVLVPSAEGEPVQSMIAPKHVVLVLVEGLSALMVAAGETPEIRDLEREGLVVRRFVTHQRQTHRGLFAALCGAYPNLLASEAKSHLLALSGLPQRCLPAELRDAGFRTVFLQSADLGYMTKDLFAQAAGFTVIKGEYELASGGTDGPWGLDDRTLLEHAADELRAHADEQTFMTLLTSGTHPPYKTPVSDNDRARAFAFASQSVGWFVGQLRAQGLLGETLVLITSDESHAMGAGDLIGEAGAIPPGNHGYLLALGAGVRPMEQPELFGQVDIAVSVLDALGLPLSGFHGASMFRRHAPGRALLAAHGFKKMLYVIGDAGLVRCDQALHCADAKGAVDATPIRALVARNELTRVTDSPLLAAMPARAYPADRPNTLLGRYVIRLPRGQGVIAALRADNGSDAARLLKLLEKSHNVDLLQIWMNHPDVRWPQKSIFPPGHS